MHVKNKQTVYCVMRTDYVELDLGHTEVAQEVVLCVSTDEVRADELRGEMEQQFFDAAPSMRGSDVEPTFYVHATAFYE
jgi:hypothetical protein